MSRDQHVHSLGGAGVGRGEVGSDRETGWSGEKGPRKPGQYLSYAAPAPGWLYVWE